MFSPFHIIGCRVMSGVKNNVGRGINIALVNGDIIHSSTPLLIPRVTNLILKNCILFVCFSIGRTGEVVKTEYFDMWAGGEYT